MIIIITTITVIIIIIIIIISIIIIIKNNTNNNKVAFYVLTKFLKYIYKSKTRFLLLGQMFVLHDKVCTLSP